MSDGGPDRTLLESLKRHQWLTAGVIGLMVYVANGLTILLVIWVWADEICDRIQASKCVCSKVQRVEANGNVTNVTIPKVWNREDTVREIMLLKQERKDDGDLR